MKEITKTSRLAGQLEKLFNMLNQDFFGGALETPVITIQSTPRAYGHYTPFNAWNVKGEGRKEVNIGAGTLDRPIENVVATLLHEMCHQYNDTIAQVQDCSRGGTYHNKHFQKCAMEHGLLVSRSDKYGWSHTSPSDALIDWILLNDIKEIRLNRNEEGIYITGGNGAENNSSTMGFRATGSNSRKYICPSCRNSVRATKHVNVACLDCCVQMILEC